MKEEYAGDAGQQYGAPRQLYGYEKFAAFYEDSDYPLREQAYHAVRQAKYRVVAACWVCARAGDEGLAQAVMEAAEALGVADWARQEVALRGQAPLQAPAAPAPAPRYKASVPMHSLRMEQQRALAVLRQCARNCASAPDDDSRAQALDSAYRKAVELECDEEATLRALDGLPPASDGVVVS